jgi:hypothetical protein
VDALLRLVHQRPLLVMKLETDVIPVLDSLTTVAPDLRELLNLTRELNELLANVPGLGRIMRRIEQEE